MKVTIKQGAVFFQDRTFYQVQEGCAMPVCDAFECPGKPDYLELSGPGYGGKPYGNGKIYIKKQFVDVVSDVGGNSDEWDLMKRYGSIEE